MIEVSATYRQWCELVASWRSPLSTIRAQGGAYMVIEEISRQLAKHEADAEMWTETPKNNSQRAVLQTTETGTAKMIR